MKSPCNECAFSKQGAGTEPYNVLRSQVCALGPIPFGCHHTIDWRSQHSWTPAQHREAIRQSGMCQGWMARVRELNAQGWYGKYRVIRRAIAKQCLELIDLFTDEKNPREKKRQLSALKRMLRFLTSKDIAHKKIPTLY